MTWMSNTWKAIGVVSTLLFIVFLPETIEKLPATLTPLVKALTEIELELYLTLAVIVLASWVIWIDIRPYIRRAVDSFRQRLKPTPHDPIDIVNAKQAIIQFSEHTGIPAAKNLDDAVRLACVALVRFNSKDPVIDNLIISGLRKHSDLEVKDWGILCDPDISRKSSIDLIENLLHKNVLRYRVAKHTLHRIVTLLQAHKLISSDSMLKNSLQNWLPLDENYEIGFAQLQKIPQLNHIRKMEFSSFISDPNFPRDIFYQALELNQNS